MNLEWEQHIKSIGISDIMWSKKYLFISRNCIIIIYLGKSFYLQTVPKVAK